MASSCSSRRACCQRASLSMGPAGPSHRVAGRSSVAVAAAHRPVLAAPSAGFAPRTAAAAVPVLAATLEAAQPLVALGADRWRDAGCARLVQCSEQIPDDTRGRGSAVGQHRGPVQKGLGEPASFGPASGDAFYHAGEYHTVQRRLGGSDEVDDDAEGVGEHCGQFGHGSACTARILRYVSELRKLSVPRQVLAPGLSNRSGHLSERLEVYVFTPSRTGPSSELWSLTCLLLAGSGRVDRLSRPGSRPGRSAGPRGGRAGTLYGATTRATP